MDWLRTWGVVVVCGVIGLGLVGYGLWEQIKPGEVVVEVVTDEPSSEKREGEERQVVVEVSGAVEKPGVYKLSVGSRVGDLLVMAGGLGGVADREWVAENLNLAAKLEDAEKVYIPARSVKGQVGSDRTQRVSESVNGVTPTQKININAASVGELDSLDGIGAVRAEAIVANRPYSKTEEIVSKAKIPASVYEKISGRLSVY